jgi:hypothetical protein
MTDKLITQETDISLATPSNLLSTDLVLVARIGASTNYKASIQDIAGVVIGELATVATSGNYTDLSNLPILGTMSSQNSSSVSISGGTITGMPSPSSSSDVATKGYVDTFTAGLTEVGASDFATTGTNLTATYNNGSSGVGATLTNSGSFAALVIDSNTVSLNQVILVKDQTSQFQNGLYTVTVVGNGSTAWVLTRATNYNQSSNVSAGTYTIIKSGTVNTGTLWIEIGQGPFTIGTTPIIFTELGVGNSTTTFIGDISGTGTGTISLTINSNVISNSKLAQMSAHTYKGNNTNSTANAANVTTAQLTADLNIFTTALQGVVPPSGSGHGTTFLRDDGVWATGPAGGATPVNGPVSSTINAIATWGNSGGSSLLSNPVTIDNSGNMSGVSIDCGTANT